MAPSKGGGSASDDVPPAAAKDNNKNGKSSTADASKGDANSKSSSNVRSSSRHLKKGSKHHPTNNEKAIIAGAAASAALLLVIMILLCVCCCKKRRRRRRDCHNTYRENPHPQAIKGYHNDASNGNNWQQHHHHHNNMHASMDGMRMTPPPPPPPGSGMSSDQSWMVAGTPPMMSSSDTSSGYSAGPYGSPHPGMAMGGYNQGCFTYNDLAAATNGFSHANLLGQGGFGFVHKGILGNGKEVAVKSLKSNSGQGEREFQAEVEIISRVHHRHLVSLVGYCIAGAQRMLVYEFVPNQTLEYHLYGVGRPTMDWPTRLKIALGSAKGFAYLHEDCNPRIIHRDIKTANILLDQQFEAKVADFGLAKLSLDTNTHVSTRIMGTFGYLAPEYASSGKLTDRSDVYSFGVVLLELITGRRPIDATRDDDDDTLVDWARPVLKRVQDQNGGFDELVDPRLGNNYNHQEMLRMVHCAAAAVRQSARRRPKMSKLVRVLEGNVSLEDLNEGVKVSTNSSGHSSSRGSSNNVSSPEFSSDEYSRSSQPNTTLPPNLPRPPGL